MRQAAAASGPAFFGRVADLEALEAIVTGGGSVVTLTGPGGVGKTRLARRFSEHAATFGLAAAPLCDLSAAHTVEEVCGVVARTLDVREGPARASALERIGQAIAALGHVLLVLDNCEQATSAVAEAVVAWSARAPEVVMMLTSREPIGVPHERVHPVLPLAVPEPGEDPTLSDAVALFVDRVARARATAYAPVGEEAKLVAELVRRLDGLPLAIELAAARAAVLGVDAIHDRLSKRFELLAGGSSALPERHRTIRATIQWSWDLLDETERRALMQCAVFTGGFTLASAEAVLDVGAASCLDVVQGLVQRSMLRSYEPRELAGDMRLGMYESIRELCLERLEQSGEQETVRAKHAAYFARQGARWAEEITGPRGARRMGELGVELGNIGAAHEYFLRKPGDDAALDAARAMLAMTPTLRAHGPHAEHVRLTDATLERCGSVDAPETRQLLILRAETRAMGGRTDEAREDLSVAIAAARRAKDARSEGRALAALGLTHWHAGDLDAGERVLGEALERSQAASDVVMEVVVLRRLANLLLHKRSLAEALRYVERGLERARSGGVRSEEGLLLATLSPILHLIGRHEEATDASKRALRLLREMGDTQREAIILGNLGVILQQAGRADEARITYEQALDAARRGADSRFLGHVHFWLGRLDHEQRRLPAAAERYDDALRLLENASDPRLRALVVAAKAALDADRGTTRPPPEMTVDVPPGDLHLAHAIEVYAMFVDLVAGRASLEAAVALRDRLAPSSESEDVVFALRVLERKLVGSRTMPPPGGGGGALHVAADGTSFFAPGATDMVDLSRRRSLRLVLLALAKHRVEAPGVPLAIEMLVKRAWPGERMLSKSGAMRAYTSITRLRKLGLNETLISRGNGYLLDPRVEIVLSVN